MNVERLQLDLDKAPVATPTLYARKGERSCLTVVADIADHGSPVDLSGFEVLLEMECPSGAIVSMGADVESSSAECVVREEAFSEAGMVKQAYFTLKDGSGTVATTQSFRIVVLPTALDGGGAAAAYSSEIEKLIERCRTEFEAGEAQRQDEFGRNEASRQAASEAATQRANKAAELVEQALSGDLGPMFDDYLAGRTLSVEEVSAIFGER